MRVSYQLTAGEYVSAQHLNYRNSFGGRLALAFYYLAAPLFGVFLLFGAVSQARMSGFGVASVIGMLLPTFIVLTPLWLRLYLRYRFRLTRIADSACHIDFEDERINTELPGFCKSTVEWAAVRKYRESEKLLLIYVSRASFFAVPVRVLASGEKSELIALIGRKMSSSAV